MTTTTTKMAGGWICYVCATGPDRATVPATVESCRHLATDCTDTDRWGLCAECAAAGPCPECAEVRS